MGYVSGLVVACGVVAVDDEDHGVDLRHVVPPELPHRRVAAEVERLERHSAELLCKRWVSGVGAVGVLLELGAERTKSSMLARWVGMKLLILPDLSR